MFGRGILAIPLQIQRLVVGNSNKEYIFIIKKQETIKKKKTKIEHQCFLSHKCS